MLLRVIALTPNVPADAAYTVRVYDDDTGREVGVQAVVARNNVALALQQNKRYMCWIEVGAQAPVCVPLPAYIPHARPCSYKGHVYAEIISECTPDRLNVLRGIVIRDLFEPRRSLEPVRESTPEDTGGSRDHADEPAAHTEDLDLADGHAATAADVPAGDESVQSDSPVWGDPPSGSD